MHPASDELHRLVFVSPATKACHTLVSFSFCSSEDYYVGHPATYTAPASGTKQAPQVPAGGEQTPVSTQTPGPSMLACNLVTDDAFRTDELDIVSRLALFVVH